MQDLRRVVIEFRGFGDEAPRHQGRKARHLLHADEALDQERHGAAAMRPDDAKLRTARGRAAEQEVGQRARRIGAELDHRVADVELGQRVGAADRRMRMGVDHGLAPVELVEHRGQHLVAEPVVAVARQHVDAVGLERIEGARDLLQRRVDVRQRQGREQAEAAGIVGREPRHVVVVLAAKGDERLALDLARDRRRVDGERDAGLVHVGDRVVLVHDRGEVRREHAPLAHGGHEFRRDQVMVDVDALSHGMSRPLRR